MSDNKSIPMQTVTMYRPSQPFCADEETALSAIPANNGKVLTGAILLHVAVMELLIHVDMPKEISVFPMSPLELSDSVTWPIIGNHHRNTIKLPLDNNAKFTWADDVRKLLDRCKLITNPTSKQETDATSNEMLEKYRQTGVLEDCWEAICKDIDHQLNKLRGQFFVGNITVHMPIGDTKEQINVTISHGRAFYCTKTEMDAPAFVNISA